MSREKEEDANMGGLEATLLQAYAGRQRTTCVLVAAMRAPGMEALAPAAEASGGRVLRSRGNELIALFANAQRAAAAAARMHHRAERLMEAVPHGLRVAFHSGPVRQRGHGIYGDALNVAAELASLAAPGQIVVSRGTAARLSAEFAPALHELRAQPGHPALTLAELDWRQIAPVALEEQTRPRSAELHLTYRYNTLLRRREGDCVTLGRDPDCDLCIDLRLASRRHCTLERRGERFMLRDHSTNGTFVTVEGEQELRIRADEMLLQARGWLSLGASRLLAEELVQFRCQ